MGPMEQTITNKFLPKLLGKERISGRLRNILELGTIRAGLGIPDPTTMADKCHKSLLGFSK